MKTPETAQEAVAVISECFVLLAEVSMSKSLAEEIASGLEAAAERLRRGVREGDFRDPPFSRGEGT